MKRFIAVLSGLLVLPAFAEVAPVYYDEIVEYTDEMLDEADSQPEEDSETTPVVQKQNIAPRNVAGRSVSRAISAGNTTAATNTTTRAVASSPRNARQTTQRGTVSRTTTTQNVVSRAQPVSRSRATVVSRNTATNSARTQNTTKPVTARVGATGNVMSGTRTDSDSRNVLRDSGEALYIPNSAAAGTGVTEEDSQIGSTVRATRRSSSRSKLTSGGKARTTVTAEDVETTKENIDALTELTDYCKKQYQKCMDNYCNVIDDNQGRCSCSDNVKNYEKTEKALMDISEQYQDVVQKIRYIGLTAAQIEALFAETEAEMAMKTNSDTSNLKNSLDTLKKKIVDVSDGKTTTTSNMGLLDGFSFDMSGVLNTDFSAMFDLNSFMGNATNNKASEKRGAALLKMGASRCKVSVLNSCIEQGVDPNLVTNAYDLEIDKHCIEYERSLTEANSEMRNNVRNAQNILQQARLMLVQQKNAYDLKGCVAALDECMQDEFVCGDDYELCLDPTGKYIAKGEIVKGGVPGIPGGNTKTQAPVTSASLADWKSGGMYGLYSTWNYNSEYNAWGAGDGENLNGYINNRVESWKKQYNKTTNTDNDMATFLLRRIGYIDAKEDKSYGMCASVLKSCQDYTYTDQTSNKQYKVDNEVIRQYLAVALTKVKLRQDEILSEYAEDCWNDVYSCLATNNYDETDETSTASKIAVGACRGEISTCMSVTGYYPSDAYTLTLSAMANWIASKTVECPENEYLEVNYANVTSGQPSQIATVGCKPCPAGTTSEGGQASMCKCPDGKELAQNYAGTISFGDSTKYSCVNAGGGWSLMVTKKTGDTKELTNDNLVALGTSGYLRSVKKPTDFTGCRSGSNAGYYCTDNYVYITWMSDASTCANADATTYSVSKETVSSTDVVSVMGANPGLDLSTSYKCNVYKQ